MNLKNLWEAESVNVIRFKNIFAFMDFCYKHGITPDNSETFYDEQEGYMYLKHPYVRQVW